MRKKWESFNKIADAKEIKRWQRFATKRGLCSKSASFYMPITNHEGKICGVVVFRPEHPSKEVQANGLFAGPSVADIYRAAFNEQQAQAAQPTQE